MAGIRALAGETIALRITIATYFATIRTKVKL